jgi:hypothetical protein
MGPLRFLSASVLLLHMAGGARAASEPAPFAAPEGSDGPPMFDGPAMSDAELSQARGGFTLPNGLDINFGVIVATSVDGVRVLQTEFQVQGSSALVQVTPYGAQTSAIGSNGSGQADGDGTTVNIGSISGEAGKDGTISATFGNGQATASRDGSVSLSIGGLSASADAQGRLQIDLGRATGQSVTNGSANDAGNGQGMATTTPTSLSTPITTVSVAGTGVTSVAELSDLLIQHQIGQQISAVVVNRGDNRVIDSQLSISLQLSDVQPMALGSVGYRVQSLGLDAAAWRATGG